MNPLKDLNIRVIELDESILVVIPPHRGKDCYLYHGQYGKKLEFIGRDDAEIYRDGGSLRVSALGTSFFIPVKRDGESQKPAKTGQLEFPVLEPDQFDIKLGKTVKVKKTT